MKNKYDSLSNRQFAFSRFFVHLIVIVILFLLPELLLSYAFPWRNSYGSYWQFYGKSFICISVFYIEYYVIIGNTLTPKVRPWQFACYNIILLLLATAVSYAMWHYSHLGAGAFRPMHHPEKAQILSITSVVRDLGLYVLTMALAVALGLSDRWRALERQRRDMADEQRESELANLKSQINPHFLFNTLNSIYALIDIDSAKARDAVHQLSTMLRYMLYQSPQKVTLRQEVEFTRNYIDLMSLRLPEGIVDCTIDIDSMDNEQIAPLIFIALVENVFKHGYTGHDNDQIKIAIKAADGVITCTTVNTFDPNAKLDKQGGIGVANLQRRLALIYGEKASFKTTIDNNIYSTVLSIKL